MGGGGGGVGPCWVGWRGGAGGGIEVGVGRLPLLGLRVARLQ